MDIEKFKEIINDELGRHQSQLRQKVGLQNSNGEIMCAMRLLNECRIGDFDKIMYLAEFIHNSWNDIELDDAMVDSIIREIPEAIKYSYDPDEMLFR